MRMAELSRRTGVPVPTIKYYLREGLLPPGERTSPNQALYDEPHVRRLKMVRALVEVGGMSIAAVRDVLDAVDAPDKIPFTVLGEVQDRLGPTHPKGTGEYWDEAERQVLDLLARRGWHADPDCPPARSLITAVASLAELGRDDLSGLMEVYAEAVEKMAEADIAHVVRDQGLDDVVEGTVIGTVLGETMIMSLRRLAHQDVTGRLYGIESRPHE
jgi:DNA-binding transcriptional MerR regulator